MTIVRLISSDFASVQWILAYRPRQPSSRVGMTVGGVILHNRVPVTFRDLDRGVVPDFCVFYVAAEFVEGGDGTMGVSFRLVDDVELAVEGED